MDQAFEAYDQDSALRPTIINTGSEWRKKTQKALLASPTESSLDADLQKEERNSAIDLLDALSRSGALDIPSADLHIILAATHCFTKTVVDTVIEDNVDPIEKIERSTIIMASTIHNAKPVDMVKDKHIERLATATPALFAVKDEEGEGGI
jgi:hypothetical protein